MSSNSQNTAESAWVDPLTSSAPSLLVEHDPEKIPAKENPVITESRNEEDRIDGNGLQDSEPPSKRIRLHQDLNAGTYERQKGVAPIKAQYAEVS